MGAFSDEIQKQAYAEANLVEIVFDEGPLRLTDYGHDIEWNGYTWLAVGQLLQVGGQTEDTNIEVAPWQITLSGVDQINVAIALQYNYIDRRATHWVMLFDDQGKMIVDPENPKLAAKGLTDTPRISDSPGGTTTLQLTVTTPYGDIDGKNGRQTNDSEQQALFPGDRGFDLVSETPRRLLWGADL